MARRNRVPAAERRLDRAVEALRRAAIYAKKADAMAESEPEPDGYVAQRLRECGRLALAEAAANAAAAANDIEAARRELRDRDCEYCGAELVYAPIEGKS